MNLLEEKQQQKQRQKQLQKQAQQQKHVSGGFLCLPRRLCLLHLDTFMMAGWVDSDAVEKVVLSKTKVLLLLIHRREFVSLLFCNPIRTAAVELQLVV